MLENENPEPVIETPKTTPQPQSKVWTDDYVQSLREEAKNNRIAKKAAEAKLKSLIGLKDDEDIDDAKITSYQAGQQKALSEAIAKANARLITAEIKALDGYDAKLLDRLVDRSKITIDDSGEIKGLTEQLEAIALEFPAVKKSVSTPGANPPHETRSERDRLIEQYNAAELRKDWATAFALERQIKALKK